MDVLPIDRKSAQRETLPAATAAKANFAGFDVVRAFAALGVVLLHASIPYAQNPMPGLSWPVRDQPSWSVDVMFWAIEVFIMPVFLLLAGFLAWQTLSRRGPAALIRNRANRLLRPLLFGVLVIMPIDLYIWLAGWLADGLIEPVKLRSLKFDGDIDRNLWGLSHLWFMEYLLLYVVVLAGIAAMARRLPGRLRRITTPTWVIGSLAAMAVAALAMRPEVVWGFQHAFAPVPSKWIYSGAYFWGGAVLAITDARLDGLKRNAARLVAPALLCSIAAVTLGRWHLSQSSAGLPESFLAQRVVLPLLTVVSATLITTALVGLAVRYVRRTPVPIAYLSAASFWVYLVHHPILALVHIDLKHAASQLPSEWKMAMAFAISVGVSLLTYEAFVRRSRFGRWIGFAWSLPSAQTEAAEAEIRRLPSSASDDEQGEAVKPRRRAA